VLAAENRSFRRKEAKMAKAQRKRIRADALQVVCCWQPD
jgi:hypothetical protein